MNRRRCLHPRCVSRWLLLFGMDWRIYLVYEHPDRNIITVGIRKNCPPMSCSLARPFRVRGREDLGSIHDEFKVVVPPGGFFVQILYANAVLSSGTNIIQGICELPDGSSSLSVPNVSIVPTFFQSSFNGNMKSDVGTRKNLYASVTLSCGDTVFFFSTDLLYLPSHSPCPKKKRNYFMSRSSHQVDESKGTCLFRCSFMTGTIYDHSNRRLPTNQRIHRIFPKSADNQLS